MDDCDSVPALRRILLEVLGLKALPRTGWVRAGVARPESVAAHTWGVAWLVLALCPAGVDRGRALALALVHDLPEVRTGDRTPGEIPPAEKTRSEREGLADLVRGLPHAAQVMMLWEEYEAGLTPEARFVRACDRLDMALQAARYAQEQGLDPEAFVDSALATLEDPILRALASS
ncbi:MAG: HD domain-containing protein [Deltaproteobacteria bacterium]|nr:HD domain-containing protein [Deltaproteobacteria bacterium]